MLVAAALGAGAGACRPAPTAASLFEQVASHNQLHEVGHLQLQFEAFHVQGLARVGDAWFLTAVEILDKPKKNPGLAKDAAGHDRGTGRGRAHLFRFDGDGNLTGHVRLETGDMYHPGGIDYDGRWLWIPVSEYRSHAPALVYRVDPRTLRAERAFLFRDHLSFLTHVPGRPELVSATWASETFYRFTTDGRVLASHRQVPEPRLDLQDCKPAGDGAMLCGGLCRHYNDNYDCGGLALYDMSSFALRRLVPVALHPRNHVVTREGLFVTVEHGHLRLYAVPDDRRPTLVVYEAD
jgi:hypothetical protein